MTVQAAHEERTRLKQMLELATNLPESDARDRAIQRIEVELLLLKLRLNSEY